MIFIWVLTYGIIYTLANKLSYLIGISSDTGVFLGLAVYIAILSVYLSKTKSQYCDVGIVTIVFKRIWLIIPVMLIVVFNIYTFGYDIIIENTWQSCFILLFSAFLEELLFRSVIIRILYYKYNLRNSMLIFLASSLLFAMLHWVYNFNGADVIEVTYMIMYSFSIGMVLCIVASRVKSILPCTLVHFLINVTAVSRCTGDYRLMVTGLSYAILGAYIVYYVLRADVDECL